jgi:hypothetical protein
MKRFKILAIFTFVAALCFAANMKTFAQAPGSQDEIMTNDEVISLVKAGLSPSIIINKIKTSKSNFDLSTDSLIKLKQANVPDPIVTAMLEAKSGKTTVSTTTTTSSVAVTGDPNDPASPHDFGIYMFEDKNGTKKMTQMAPNVSAQNRTGGGFTSSMTYGIGKVKTKANLPGTAATLQIQESQPVFYFYLDTKSGGLNTSSGVPSTPNEFALVKFNIRSDNREVTISKQNAYGGKGGLSDEYVVPFKSESLGNGVFKITPTAPLKNGEYGFYLINSGGSNTSAAIGAKFFDFGVKLVP